MHRKQLIAHHEHMIDASSYSSENDNYESLDVLSSAVPQRRGGISLQRDSFSRKYDVQWKYDLSI